MPFSFDVALSRVFRKKSNVIFGTNCFSVMPASGPVNILRQTIYCFVPVLDLYAAYHIKKLRMYMLIMILTGLAMSVVGEVINPSGLSEQPMTPGDELNLDLGKVMFGPNPETSIAIMIADTAIAYIIAIYFIRKWSRKWNEQF
jgi:hypothetical protein